MIEIALTQGYVTIVDAVDADLGEVRWKAFKSGQRIYANHSWPKNQLMHRVIMERILGRPLLRSEWVDHWDNNSLNNRRKNLRLSTASQNSANRKKTKSTTGYKGVSRTHCGKRYRAGIMVNKRSIHLGTFNTAEEAHAAYCEAAIKYFGEYARFG